MDLLDLTPPDVAMSAETCTVLDICASADSASALGRHDLAAELYRLADSMLPTPSVLLGQAS